MKKAEYRGDTGCPQGSSAEHKGSVGARSVAAQEIEESDGR